MVAGLRRRPFGGRRASWGRSIGRTVQAGRVFCDRRISRDAGGCALSGMHDIMIWWVTQLRIMPRCASVSALEIINWPLVS